MAITDIFQLPNPNLLRIYSNRDGTAIDNLRTLRDVMSDTPHLTYARGTWGYTVFRTVFTEESESLFPIAISKLQKWLPYWIHHNRFPWWGEEGERMQKSDGIANEEVWQRFRMDVIQDKELNIPVLRGATAEAIERLCHHFHDWVSSVGGDPELRNSSTHPRMQLFLAIDSESLHELSVNLSDEPPLLRVPPTYDEYVRLIQGRCGWLWVFDYNAIQGYDADKDPISHRGWMDLSINEIEGAWFYKARGLKRDQRILECEEYENRQGTICYGAHSSNF